VEQLAEVKRLLYEEGYTIAGARKRLRRPASPPPLPEGTAAASEAGSPGLQSPAAGRIRVPAPAAPQAVGSAEPAEPHRGEAPRPERSEAVLAALEARCQALEQELQAERDRAKAFRQQVRDELEQLAQLAEATAGPDGA
jgi:DNA-binding transcriptional MerR regulator